jgi:succinoglycan biosynthesis protein ExoM
MYLFIKESHADGVLGPVLPHFPAGAPKWLEKSGLCERPRNTSGSPIRYKDLRTGNALFQCHVFEEDGIWFDPSRGHGGEDGEFLSRQINRGRKFVWCDEAIVFETVSKERWPAKYYLKRNFTIGAMAGEYHRRLRNMKAVLIDFFLLLGYSAMMPFSLLGGKHIWMKVLAKTYYHAGCLLSFLNLTHVPHRQ